MPTPASTAEVYSIDSTISGPLSEERIQAMGATTGMAVFINHATGENGAWVALLESAVSTALASPLEHRVTALEERLARLEAAVLPDEDELEPVREGVSVEQAAEEVINLLEAVPRPLTPSELMTILCLDATLVLDALDILKARGWVGAPEGKPEA